MTRPATSSHHAWEASHDRHDPDRPPADRRRGARRGRPRAAQRDGRAGPGGGGVRGGVRRSSSAGGTASRSTPAPPPCTSACSPLGSARATRSSCRRSPSPRPRTRCGWPARPRSSPTSSRAASASTRPRSRPPITRAPRRSCRCTSTATRPPWTGSARSPSGTASPSSRTPPRRTPPRCTAARSARFGDVRGCFSFYPTKNMTSGEGGMVATADAELARTVRLLRNQGMEQRYANEIVGANNRMTDVHAAIGRVQLAQARRLDRAAPGQRARSSTRNLARRRHPAGRRRRARTSTTSTRCGCPATATRSRAALSRARRRQRRLLPDPDPPAAVVRPHDLDLPETERAAREVLSLPVHPR